MFDYRFILPFTYSKQIPTSGILRLVGMVAWLILGTVVWKCYERSEKGLLASVHSQYMTTQAHTHAKNPGWNNFTCKKGMLEMKHTKFQPSSLVQNTFSHLWIYIEPNSSWQCGKKIISVQTTQSKSHWDTRETSASFWATRHVKQSFLHPNITSIIVLELSLHYRLSV